MSTGCLATAIGPYCSDCHCECHCTWCSTVTQLTVIHIMSLSCSLKSAHKHQWHWQTNVIVQLEVLNLKKLWLQVSMRRIWSARACTHTIMSQSNRGQWFLSFEIDDIICHNALIYHSSTVGQGTEPEVMLELSSVVSGHCKLGAINELCVTFSMLAVLLLGGDILWALGPNPVVVRGYEAWATPSNQSVFAWQLSY